MNVESVSDIYPRFLPVGEAALSVEFGNAIDPAINQRVIALDLAIAMAEIPGIVEAMPTFRSLMVCYDPAELTFEAVVDEYAEMTGVELADALLEAPVPSLEDSVPELPPMAKRAAAAVIEHGDDDDDEPRKAPRVQ